MLDQGREGGDIEAAGHALNLCRNGYGAAFVAAAGTSTVDRVAELAERPHAIDATSAATHPGNRLLAFMDARTLPASG